MSSKSSVRKSRLSARFEEEGYRSVVPCIRCVRLKRVCVRSDHSDRCADCVKGGGGVKCIMSQPSYSDAEWRRLVKVQEQIAEERRRAIQASQEAMAKVLRLERHEALLRSRAGDFIARDYKEIAELEELERREAEALERIEKERVEAAVAKQAQESNGVSSRSVVDCSVSQNSRATSSAAGDGNQCLAATSEDPTLTQMIASADPSVDWSSVDFDAFFASVPEASSSSRGNTVEPAGGSPSSAR